ncbi:hypothetical protein F2Q68_00014546 [Brassica cretica]|uniref:RRM domain-containing protein n=1 Tax=Brassica cretica TaxID=69181 RepID=A0A8S9H6C0_BRACR|nr:hypothetical protein F2Q68_00014546 [Brassica cretica]
MAVVESGDSGAVVQPTSSPTSQDSDDQNHQSSRIELGDEEGLYSKIGSHPEGSDGGESYKREMRELQELFSKLNPMAAEFVPPSLSKQANAGSFFPGAGNVPLEVVDCRICGDPNSVLRFAFIEFTDEEGAMTALNLSGTMLGFYPVKVLPSKTAIAPVNPTFLPRTEDEREMCARTIYCTNIDKKVTQSDVKIFFESFCGEVLRLRLLGDYQHSTRIAFVEFVMAESAIAALNCSGVVLGSLPIRVSPSKTPVRPRSPRHPMH